MTHLLFSVFIAICWAWMAYDGLYNRERYACVWISALIGWQIFKSLMESVFLAAIIKGLGL